MENQEKQNNSQPHVKIFNEEINSQNIPGESKDSKHDGFHYHHHVHDHHHKHMGGGLFGLVVLFIGILLLFNNFGVVSMDVWNYIWPFWPLLLILMGLRIIFGFSRVIGFVIFLVAFVLFCMVVLYALIHVGSPLVYSFNLPPDFVNFISQLR